MAAAGIPSDRDIASHLGVHDATPLDQRGQKTVLKGTREGVDVAVKIVRIVDGRQEPAAVIMERAQREYELLAAANHQNLVRVIGDLAVLGDPVHTVAWLEEFVNGADLDACLTGEQWTWGDVSTMAQQVAGGLNVLHAENVVHRDVSPGNVRRRDDGTYCVMDPGYARQLDRTTLTVMGQPGTVGYFSPEHLDSQVGPQPCSDIFSLGVLMYRALAGNLPFRADDGDYGRRITSERAAPVRDLRVDLTADQGRIVDTALERLAPRRFRDADHFLRELSALD